MQRDEKFEAMLDAELLELDAKLRCAFAPPAAPPQMVDDIHSACGLAQVMRVEAPPGLTDQIFDATAHRVGRGPVLAWLGRYSMRLAAAVLLLASIFTGLLTYKSYVQHERVAQADVVLADIALREFARDAELAGPAIRGLDAEALDLAIEIDQLAWAVEGDPLGELLDDRFEQLSDELLMMEVQSDVF